MDLHDLVIGKLQNFMVLQVQHPTQMDEGPALCLYVFVILLLSLANSAGLGSLDFGSRSKISGLGINNDVPVSRNWLKFKQHQNYLRISVSH